jgi:superfamily II DNA/RNA helicase
MLGHATAKVGTWRDWSGKYAVLESVRTPNGTIQKPVALKNQNKLKEEMKDTVFLRTHTSPDVNSSLPSARHVTHSMEMTKEQSKLYSAMQDDVMHELEGMNDDDYKKNAVNVLAKMKHLEQIATDPDQLNPEKVDMKKLYPKEQWAVDTIADHLEDKENRGIVVFSDSKLPLEKVKAGLISEGLSSSQIGIISGDVSPEKRKAVQDAFSDGKIKVVLATSAGEEGINLQAGGHTMIHMDTPWVPKSITQREGRILRTGQPSKHTLFYSPVMSGTVEDQKRGKLGAKVAEIEKLLGEGAAGSAAENVSAAAKAWTLADMKEMLGVGKLGTTKKIKKSFVQRGRLLIKKRRRAG